MKRLWNCNKSNKCITSPLEPEQAMSIFAYDSFWHSSNFLLYVVSVPNGSQVGVDIACSGSKGTIKS